MGLKFDNPNRPSTTPEAEAELCQIMGPRIRRYGLRHLRDHHAAEDLTQQVLVTTLQALRAGRLRESDKIESFILGTCRMMVLDLRRTGHDANSSSSDLAPQPSTPLPHPPSNLTNTPSPTASGHCVSASAP